MKNTPAAPAGATLPVGVRKHRVWFGWFDRRTLTENISMCWMVLPGLIWLVLFWLLPFPYIVIAFKDFKAIKGPFESEWNGWYNIEFFFNMPRGARLIRNSLAYGIWGLATGWFNSSMMAIIYFHLRNNKALRVYNTIMILPNFMSVVMIAFIVKMLLHPTAGFFNQWITALGGERVFFYREAKYWPFIIVFGKIWAGIAMGSVMYYAHLMGMDPALLEAAEIDGANLPQRIIHILYPHLTPMIVTLLILNVGGIIGGDIGWHMIIPSGGQVGETTEVLAVYTFTALMGGELEKSSCMGIFFSMITLILTVIANLIVRKIQPESAMF